LQLVTGRPAPGAAMPVLCLLSGPKKWIFRPTGATRCPDKGEFGTGERTFAPLSGQKCGNTVPKTVKISNFG